MQEHGLQSGNTGLIWVVIGMMVWVLAADARGQSVGSHELQSLPVASGKGGLAAQRQSAEQRQMLLNVSLIYAVKNGQILQADDFLKRGAEPDAADGDGMTALMHAALLGNRELVDLMITHHADVNAMDNNGMTALMQAAWAGHEEVVDDLLVAGAMLDLKTSPHTTRITKSGANALIAAAIGGNLEVVRYLLGQGAKVNECDADGETALLQAARGGNPRLVELLLRNGADSEEDSPQCGSVELNWAFFGSVSIPVPAPGSCWELAMNRLAGIIHPRQQPTWSFCRIPAGWNGISIRLLPDRIALRNGSEWIALADAGPLVR